MIVFVYTSSVHNSFKLFVKYKNGFVLGLGIRFLLLVSSPKNIFFRQKLQRAVWAFSGTSSCPLIIFLSLLILLRLFIIVKLVQIEQGPLKV